MAWNPEYVDKNTLFGHLSSFESFPKQKPPLPARKILEDFTFIDANLSYWAKMPKWSLEETCALSLGKNPPSLCVATINNYTDELKKQRVAEQYLRIAKTGFAPHPSDPAQFFNYIMDLRKIDYPVPESLYAIDGTAYSALCEFDLDTEILLPQEANRLAGNYIERLHFLERLAANGDIKKENPPSEIIQVLQSYGFPAVKGLAKKLKNTPRIKPDIAESESAMD